MVSVWEGASIFCFGKKPIFFSDETFPKIRRAWLPADSVCSRAFRTQEPLGGEFKQCRGSHGTLQAAKLMIVQY